MRPTLVSLLLANVAAASLDVDTTNTASIKKAAKQVADNLLSYYHGNQPGGIPGVLPGPPPSGDYYWWESGALWGALIDYWHLTGDASYNDVTQRGILFQTGEHNDFMPVNWTASMGNDDQGFWAMAAMLAAETGFQNPGSGQPQWLALAQAVMDDQAARRDDTCGGGLRWQIPFANNGYNYKNSLANAVFFNMGARLGRFTGNATYQDLASTAWDWLTKVGFLTAQYDVYDGAHVETNCTDINKVQFSSNAGILLQGAAFMFNQTTGKTQDTWRQRLNGVLNRTVEIFFQNSIPVEVACETDSSNRCNTDMLPYKGVLIRAMISTAQVAPFTHAKIVPLLKSAAAAAAKSCDGATCGFRWTRGSYDQMTGVGQQMNALAALSGLLVDEAGVQGPATSTTAGNSTSTSAGTPAKTTNPNGASRGAGSAAGIGAAVATVCMALLACGI